MAASGILQRIGTGLDRVIGLYDPDKALRRHRSRQLLARAYEGASTKDGWRPKRAGASANADHAADARTLRIRARSLEQNVPYIAQGLRAHTANIVGTGIVPRWKDSEKLDSLWAQWLPFADADGRLDAYGLMHLAHQTAQRDGEVLLRIRPRYASDGLPVPVQFQLLEIDWLDDARSGKIDGLQVINGIAYNATGKVAGYYLFDKHPGEFAAFGSRTASKLVAAESIIHYFAPQRPGQGRGFTRLAPVIARCRDLMLYEDAELQRKNLETRLSVVASGDVNAMGNTDPTEAAPATTDVRSLGELASGSIMQLPSGTNLTAVEPKAAGGYAEYVKLALHLIAAGAGWTYEMMTGDVRETTFSSARIRRLDYKREAEQEQWLAFIPMLVAQMVRTFALYAELANKVPHASFNVRYATPKWEYVDPQKDVVADLAEIAGGLSSFSEKLRQRGYDPTEVHTELSDDIKRLDGLKILDVLLLMQKGRQRDDAREETEGQEPKK